MPNRKKFFTLVELLAVIAIIGILAGILIPVLGGAQTRGKITQAKSDMKTIETALEALASDNGGRYMIPTEGRRGTTYAWGGQTIGNGSPVKVSGSNMAYMLVELSDPEKQGIVFNNNKRKIRYLEPPKGYQDTIATCDWPDPWGNSYNTWINVDGSSSMMPHGSHKVFSNVLLWSWGPNGENNKGANAETDNCSDHGETLPADDVASWHK